MHSDPVPTDPEPRSPHVTVRVVHALLEACGYLSAVLILMVLGVICYAIVQRYVLGTPLLWGDELIGYALVAIVMLGAAEALRRGDHIAMDLFSARAGARLGRALEAWSNLAVLAFSIVLGWSTWESIAFAIDFGSYAIGHIEIATWIPQVPMLAGALLLALTATLRLIQCLFRVDAS